MTLIHPYYYVNRSIKNGQQLYEEQECFLTLSNEAITTNDNLFKLEEVFDVSYRPTTSVYGFLYLHTNKGVYSFNVKHSPEKLIEQFHSMK